MRFIINLLAAFVFILTVSVSINAQSWKPEPMKSAVCDKLMGSWTSEPHDFMGSTRTDFLTHSMKHNGQYMVIDISSKSSDGVTYTGTLYMNVDKDGNLKGWGFGDFGGVTTYTGKTIGDNKISVTGINEKGGTEQREIEITGNKMVHNVSFTMKGADGKDMTANMTITFNKN